MDIVRSILRTVTLDKKFWSEALSTPMYIRNRKLLHHFLTILPHITHGSMKRRIYHIFVSSVAIVGTHFKIRIERNRILVQMEV